MTYYVAAVHDRTNDAYLPSVTDRCGGTVRGASPGRICGKEVYQVIAGVSLCRGHADKMHAWCNAAIAEKAQYQRDAEEIRKEDHQREMRSWAADGSQIVYYVLRRDGMIKIGTSANFAARLIALGYQHGPLSVLLTHCGDHEREREMHRQFAHLRVTGEWFLPGPGLLRWILATRRKRANAQTRLECTVTTRHIGSMIKAADEALDESANPAA